MKLVLLLVLLCGCGATRDAAVGAAATGAGAAAGGAVGGPGGAAVGAVAGYLWSVLTSEQAAGTVEALGFFARWGHKLDQLIGWAILAGVVLLFLVPRWRSLTVAFLTGIPRAIVGIAKKDGAAVKAGLADVALWLPRLGPVRESPRTRPKPKPPA